MYRLFLAVLFLLTAVTAFADDLKPGWSVQFHQDTFDRTIMPLAIVSEVGDDFDKASLGAVCSRSGAIVLFFQPERFMLFDTSSEVSFRAGQGVVKYRFVAGKIPGFGSLLIVDEAQSREIATLFSDAKGDDIAFRTDKKNGLISSIGADTALEIVRENCPAAQK
ncbi:hypothetical protein [Martelella soudanensis]|uniref:hypothetical protein n=1 Tax=unclassified Martelella TaxID=2629616 RepID=UPI0015DD9AEA|nr:MULTISPECIES: hypothetical protein [unclassified Martelella]